MYNKFNMNISPSNIKQVGESVFGQSFTKLPNITLDHRINKTPSLNPAPGKKQFKKLIKRASKPLPKAQDK